MNRLVIIGNGFDLANGLKSRYEDFIVWYLKKLIKEFDDIKIWDRVLIELRNLPNVPNSELIHDRHETINDFLNDRNILIVGLSNSQKSNRSIIQITFHSPLFLKIFSNKNWTDIERTYFEVLKVANEQGLTQLKYLNEDFSFLKSKLVEYLKFQIADNAFSLNKSLSGPLGFAFNLENNIIEQYEYDLREKLRSIRLDVQKEKKNKLKKDETVFVNFNYSRVLNLYLTEFFKLLEHKEIHIHGNLFDPENIIFGYGDEKTELFEQFKEANENELLKNFKSFHYAAKSNYLTLLNFLSEPFDVTVVGHSLGLSDRVLLNTIFEHDNCKMIHLFHRGGDSHFRLRMALGRHFNDPAKFREKLMPENKNFELPS